MHRRVHGIAVDLNDPGLAAAARTALAWYDATDGITPDRDAIADASRLSPHALDARDHQATLTLAEGMAALATGRPRNAQPVFLRLADPSDPAYKPMFRIVSLPDLTQGWHAQVISGALGLARIMLPKDMTLDEIADELETRPLPCRSSTHALTCTSDPDSAAPAESRTVDDTCTPLSTRSSPFPLRHGSSGAERNSAPAENVLLMRNPRDDTS